ncbi:MAG: hypothetical protein HON23_02780 [Rickettsiales bacterium]|jgi:hypothetical protein|nr:hypothetical protein [Rickettsiales bacterium]
MSSSQIKVAKILIWGRSIILSKTSGEKDISLDKSPFKAKGNLKLEYYSYSQANRSLSY